MITPRAIFLPRLFLRAALARARLSVAAKLCGATLRPIGVFTRVVREEPRGAEWAPRREFCRLIGAECLPGLFAIGFGARAPASSINTVVRMRNPKIPGKGRPWAAFDKKTGFWRGGGWEREGALPKGAALFIMRAIEQRVHFWPFCRNTTAASQPNEGDRHSHGNLRAGRPLRGSAHREIEARPARRPCRTHGGARLRRAHRERLMRAG